MCFYLLLFLACLCFPHSTFAQNISTEQVISDKDIATLHKTQSGVSILVAPAVVETTMQNGQQRDSVLLVKNTSSHQQDIYLEKSAINITNDGRTLLDDNEYDNSIVIYFPSSHITLAPGATERVPYTITVTQDATIGTHVAAIVVRTACQDDDTYHVALCVQTRIGIPVLINVGTRVYKSDLAVDFDTLPYFLITAHSNIVTTVHNKSVYAVRPHIVTTMTSLLGHEIARVEYDNKYVILPQRDRLFHVVLDHPHAFGLYRITVRAIDENGGIFQHSEWRVVLTQWRMATIVFCGIFGVFLWYRWWRRHEK